MRNPTPRLNNAELGKIDGFLAKHSHLSLHEVHGHITSAYSGPVEVHPAQWLSFVFPDADKVEQDKDELLPLMLRLHNQIVSDLVKGNPKPLISAVEHKNASITNDEDALALWCDGYLSGIGYYSEYWEEEEETEESFLVRLAFVVFTLFSTKGGEFLKDSPNVEDLDELLDNAPEVIPDLVRNLNDFWNEEDIPKVKVGRNDPCFCDSGKKYKHCCLQ